MYVPQNQNVSRKEYGRLPHSKDFQTEITKMWELITPITPVIGALRMVKKRADNYINQLHGNFNLVNNKG